MIVPLLLAGIVVLITHGIATITGFGGAVLAFPFVTVLLGVAKAKAILATVSWFLALYIVVTSYRHLNVRQFLIITGVAGLGLPAGILFFNSYSPETLKLWLGVFIVVSAVVELRKFYFPLMSSRSAPGWFYLLLLLLGGVIHGAFATGGPLIILYAARAVPDKSGFRATLCSMWLALNTVMIATDPTFAPMLASFGACLTQAQAPSGEALAVLIMMPFLVTGIVLGERVHDRVDGELFRKTVFWVLLVCGVFMVASRYV